MNPETPLKDFIASPDTISLVFRDGSLANEQFRRRHKIRSGTVLSGDYHVDYVHRDQLEGIIAESGEGILAMLPIVMGLSDSQSLDASGITRARLQPHLDLRGQGTLTGFIDTGVDYTSSAFIYEDGTSKIRYIWDQTLRGKEPDGFHFGAEFSASEINAALASPNPRERVPHVDTSGHGTFLASVAAGRETALHIGAAPDAGIIAVKLKKASPFFYERFLIPESQQHAYESSDLLLGIQYIVNKAAELGRPVAICIALGSNTGGHDGQSLTEEFLTRMSNVTGVAIACAAGNESQSGRHTSGRLASSGEMRSIELLVENQDEDVYMSIFNSASDRIAVSVTSPAGETAPRLPVRSGSSYSTNLVLEASRVSVEYFLPLRGSGDQYTAIRLIHPTPGIWRINVYGEIILDGAYHSWLPVTGLTGPGTRFLAPSPNYTVTIPATAVGVTSCGAYDSRSNTLYPFSSWGPTRRPMSAPDLVAPGVGVGGMYPTGYGEMSGTSASAAITTGASALLLQWGIVDGNDASMTSSRVRANLIRGCERDDFMQYPNPQWGYGRLNLFGALNVMRPVG